MLDSLKRIAGYLLVLLVALNLAYALLSLLYALSWEGRAAVVSALLLAASLAVNRLK
jgi:hypothetical protein